MAAEVGIGANARPDHPLFTFCHLRRHATVAKVGDPAGFTSLQAGLHHPGTAECCNRVRAIVDNCVIPRNGVVTLGPAWSERPSVNSSSRYIGKGGAVIFSFLFRALLVQTSQPPK